MFKTSQQPRGIPQNAPSHSGWDGRVRQGEKKWADRPRRSGHLPEKKPVEDPTSLYTVDSCQKFLKIQKKTRLLGGFLIFKRQAAEERNRHAVCAS
jgi:hypothetical protein